MLLRAASWSTARPRAAARSAGSSPPAARATSRPRRRAPTSPRRRTRAACRPRAPAASTVTTASAVAAPRAQHHGRLEEVDEAHRRRLQQRLEQLAAPPRCRRRACRPPPRAPAASRRSGRRRTPPCRAGPARRACAGRRTRRCRCGRRPTYTAAFRSASRSRRRMPRPLSMSTAGGPRAPCGPSACAGPRASARSATRRTARSRGRLVRRAAPVERGDGALVLRPHAQAVQLVVVGVLGEAPDPPLPRRHLAIELDLGAAGPQQLDAVVADVGDRPDRDDLPGDRRLAAAHARDAAVAAGDLDQQRARRLGDGRVIGVADDRGQRPVDVEQDAGARGIRPERLRVSRSASRLRTWEQYGAPGRRGRAVTWARRHPPQVGSRQTSAISG